MVVNEKTLIGVSQAPFTAHAEVFNADEDDITCLDLKLDTRRRFDLRSDE